MGNRFDHIDINNEKVNKIINCSYEEFSKYSFEKASTNNIIKEAGVSRGLLYHYFKDKQELYDFLVFFSIRINAKEMEEKLDWEESDILNRIRQGMLLKFEIINRYPYMIEFYQKIADPKTISNLRAQSEDIFPGLRHKFYTHNIDFSHVKDGVDIDKMINVIRWTFKGKSQEYMDEIKSKGMAFDSNKLIEECDDYIEFLRAQFFK